MGDWVQRYLVYYRWWMADLRDVLQFCSRFAACCRVPLAILFCPPVLKAYAYTCSFHPTGHRRITESNQAGTIIP